MDQWTAFAILYGGIGLCVFAACRTVKRAPPSDGEPLLFRVLGAALVLWVFTTIYMIAWPYYVWERISKGKWPE